MYMYVYLHVCHHFNDVMFFRQKVTLWQHADELEEEQQRMGRWVNSKGVTECMECGTTFTLLTRKVDSHLPSLPSCNSGLSP